MKDGIYIHTYKYIHIYMIYIYAHIQAHYIYVYTQWNITQPLSFCNVCKCQIIMQYP